MLKTDDLKLLESASAEVLLLNPAGTVVYLNAALRKTLGLPLEAETAVKLWDIDPGYSIKKFEEIKALARAQKTVSVAITHKDSGRSIAFGLSWTEVDAEAYLIGFAATAPDEDAECNALNDAKIAGDVLDAIQSGINVLDREFNVVRTNRWLKERLPNLRSGVKCYKAVHNLETICPWCQTVACFETGEVQKQIIPLPDAENPETWSEVTIYPVKNDQGAVVNAIEFVKDITDLVESRNSVCQQQKELESLIDALPVNVFVKDAEELRFVNFNQSCAQFMGQPKEEMIGKNDYDFFDQATADFMTSKDREVLASKTMLDIPVEQIHTPQGMVYAHTRKVPICDTSGNPKYLLGISEDITEKVEMENELKRYKEQLEYLVQERTKELETAHKIIKSTHEGVWILGPDKRTLEINGSLLDMLGYTMDEMLGKTPLEFVDEENAKIFRCQTARIETTDHRSYEIELTRKDGSQQPCLFNANSIYDNEGKLAYACAFVTDLTEQKRVHRELIQAKETAESASRTKAQFLANMSHEIRTPMNGIIGMTHLALQTALDDRQKNYISKAYRSAESLLRILDDILDFSKIEAGKLELEQIGFQLKEVIDNYVNVLRLKAEEQSIQLAIRIDREVPRALLGDPLRLGQILINLGGNAIKFSHAGGSVSLQVSLMEETDLDTLLHFSIQDRGIGMSEEQQRSVFQAFSQGDSSTTRRYGGTGLGLIISKNIIHMMGGDIWLESEPGVGSTFHFTARLGKQQGSQASEDSTARQVEEAIEGIIAGLHGTRILLVEDNEINQELVLELLTGKGIEVEAADNGEQALELLANENFDGVLMDCQMPVMDGYETTRRIREQEKFKDLPIIAMTANAMKGDREKVLAAGMNDHIPKPIRPEIMFKTMAKWIAPKAMH